MSMILPIVTFLPLVGALLCLALPREEEQLHRSVGIGTALLPSSRYSWSGSTCLGLSFCLAG